MSKRLSAASAARRIRASVLTAIVMFPFVLAALGLAAWWCFRPGPGAAQDARVLRITFDGGGPVVQYIERFNEIRLAGGRVVIDGLCISACTMVTGLMPADRLCVTPFAQLAFHSAATVNPFSGDRAHSSEGTRIVWHIYPEPVRKLLLTKEWNGDDKTRNDHPDLIYVAGDELRTIVRPCAANEIPNERI